MDKATVRRDERAPFIDHATNVGGTTIDENRVMFLVSGRCDNQVRRAG